MLANLKFAAALAVVFDRAGVSGAVLQIPVNHELKIPHTGDKASLDRCG